MLRTRIGGVPLFLTGVRNGVRRTALGMRTAVAASGAYSAQSPYTALAYSTRLKSSSKKGSKKVPRDSDSNAAHAGVSGSSNNTDASAINSNSTTTNESFEALLAAVRAQLEEYCAANAPLPLTEQDFVLSVGAGRARCRSCGYHIARGEVRVGVQRYSSQGDYTIPHWHHLFCFAHIDRRLFDGYYCPAAAPLTFSTSKHLSRDLTVGAGPYLETLRAISGDASVTLSEAQRAEVNWVARRYAMAVASADTTALHAQDGASTGDSKTTQAKKKPRGGRSSSSSRAGAGGGSGGRSSSSSPMGVAEMVEELSRNYGKQTMERYLQEHYDCASADEVAASSRHRAAARRGLLQLLADGRAFGALDGRCISCGALLRATSSGAAVCTGYLDSFTACGRRYPLRCGDSEKKSGAGKQQQQQQRHAGVDVGRVPWKYTDSDNDASGGVIVARVPEKHWEELGIVDEQGSLLLPCAYSGNFVQLEVPVVPLARDAGGVDASSRPYVGMRLVVANLPLPQGHDTDAAVQQLLTLPGGSSGSGSSGATASAADDSSAVSVNAPPLVLSPHDFDRFVEIVQSGAAEKTHGAAKAETTPEPRKAHEKKKSKGGKSAETDSTYSLHSRLPAWPPNEPYRWVGVAADAAEAKAMVSKTPYTTPFPVFPHSWLPLCRALGFRPPFLDEAPVGDLYLANKPELTALERRNIEEHKAKIEHARAQLREEQEKGRSEGDAEEARNSSDVSASPAPAPAPASDANVVVAKFLGAFPVDYMCPDSHRYTVVLDFAGVRPYSMQLVKTDVRRGQNTFYVAQALREEILPDGKTAQTDLVTCYRVFRRWGRVGDDMHSSQTLSQPMTHDSAVGLFLQLFEERTGNPASAFTGVTPYEKKANMYHFVPSSTTKSFAASAKKLQVPVSELGAADERGELQPGASLDANTAGLLADLFSMSGLAHAMRGMQIDLRRLPLGSLSEAALVQAGEALDEIATTLEQHERKTRNHFLRTLFGAADDAGASEPAPSGGAATAGAAAAGADGGGAVTVPVYITDAEARWVRKGTPKKQSPADKDGSAANSANPQVFHFSAARVESARLQALKHAGDQPLLNRILSLSNRFYSIIPHRLPSRSAQAATPTDDDAEEDAVLVSDDGGLYLRSSERVLAKRALLDDLTDVLRAREIAEVTTAGGADGSGQLDASAETLALLRQAAALHTNFEFMGSVDGKNVKPAAAASGTASPPSSAAVAGQAEVDLTLEQIVRYFGESASPLHSRQNATITGVWRLTRPREQQSFRHWCDTHRDLKWSEATASRRRSKKKKKESEQLPVRRMFLWHGSRFTNWVRVLQDGLQIAPPHAVASGSMFGQGIYLADLRSKATLYSLKGRNPAATVSDPASSSSSDGKTGRAAGAAPNEREYLVAICEAAIGNDPLVVKDATNPTKLILKQQQQTQQQDDGGAASGVKDGKVIVDPPYSLLAVGQMSMSKEVEVLPSDNGDSADTGNAGAGGVVLPSGECVDWGSGTVDTKELVSLPVRRYVGSQASAGYFRRLALRHNEYVVYNPQQVRLRYLVSFKVE